MNNFFIYKFSYPYKPGQTDLVSATMIFCDRTRISEDNLKEEIKRFYQKNYQSDKIFVIGGEYLKDELIQTFIVNQDNTFKGIPKRQETFLSDNLYVLTFDKKGEISCINGKEIPEMFNKRFLNEGLQEIFIKRGGLVTSQDAAHHFVFPSGKHCDKFLRTGNILLISCEIYFISFALLRVFDEKKYDQIYCDTSSINTVAFALVELKNRFLVEKDRNQIPIESFSSYEGLYKRNFTYGRNAFLLISASTSTNIISYIFDNHKIIHRDSIVILYFLGAEEKYRNIEDQVLCNLTLSNNNPNGINSFPSFQQSDCQFCKAGSYAVEVVGDVFLLEKPKVNSLTLSVKDMDPKLPKFMKEFISNKRTQSVLKVNYKEDSEQKYEIYIDYSELLEGIKSHGRYNSYKIKLNNSIDQFIPSNVRYIVSLNDQSSKDLSQYILDNIAENFTAERMPIIIDQNNLSEISTERGAVVVVGSCVTNGKNLLYIS